MEQENEEALLTGALFYIFSGSFISQVPCSWCDLLELKCMFYSAFEMHENKPS